ncbi:MAG: serine/threonine protein kinase [Panacagrimonas sp.]|nr:SUMF1/EgtB/PvdO family nonheme iron enzyme [Panacagrimonas sp.]MCC2657457.1 serine/threonine protein kinase [Panacagrimonas sp.]
MSAPSVLADGTWIDNFRVVRRLGRGGFGVTYLAEEFREWEAGSGTGSPLRLVAIKEYFPRGLATRPDGHTVMLSPDVEGGEQAFQMALKGFFQEAESLMRFDHPNVIKIHRVFQRNGTAYYIMPFLKGETLKAILKRDGAMGEERARRLMLPILDGLIHAHAKGILHRDLKPDNVMVPDEGGPVLIDFGAARAQAVDDVQEYTRHSELVAYTPGYAALEQYGRATRDNLHGAHTDVYGLAAVLYHCVTGEAPIEASLRSMQLSNGAVDPLSPASSRLMDTPGYGRAFLSAIDWGLELAGRSRPQTVAEFRRALDGKLTLPEHTLARLEQHGVSTEPFTRPGPTTRTISPTVPVRDTQQLATRLLSEPTDTVVGHPATRPSIQTGPLTDPLTGPTTGPITGRHTTTPTMPVPVQDATVMFPPQPAAAAPAPKSGSGSGKLLPILGLLVSVIAVAYVARDQVPEGVRAALPEGLRAQLWPAPPAESTVATPVTPPASIEPAPVPVPVPEPPREDPKAVAEREAFEAAKSSDSLEGWKAFKKAFPDSALAATADIRIAALQPKPTPKPVPTPPPVPERAAPVPVPVPSPPVAEAPPQPKPETAPVPRPAPQPKTLSGGFRDCPACPEMVKVPGGSLEMGDVAGTGEADEKPLRQIGIGAFYAGRYEVTFDDWAGCVSGGGCNGTPRDAGWGRGRRPVINVSWNDAQRYASWLSRESGKRYRLPSEAEFEYMMRAGSRSTYPWGEDGSQACLFANVADRQAKKQNPDWNTFPCDDGNPLTAPVGSYRANPFGLFDVAGNVWEWTLDCYQSYRQAASDGSPSNPANCARRVIRGGSWSDATRNLRSADRTASSPNATLKIVGFRVVRD